MSNREMNVAVSRAVDDAVRRAMNAAVYRPVDDAVYRAVDWAVNLAVADADPHSALERFLKEVEDE